MANADDDPLYPWLLAIKSGREDLGKKIDDSEVRLENLVKGCIAAFEKDSRYPKRCPISQNMGLLCGLQPKFRRGL